MTRKTITGATSVQQWQHRHVGTTHRLIRIAVPNGAADHLQATADLLGVSRTALIVHLMATVGPATDALRSAVEATAARMGTRIVLTDGRGQRRRLGSRG